MIIFLIVVVALISFILGHEYGVKKCREALEAQRDLKKALLQEKAELVRLNAEIDMEIEKINSKFIEIIDKNAKEISDRVNREIERKK